MSAKDKITELYHKNLEFFKKIGLKLSEEKAIEFMAEGKLADGTIVKTPSASFEVGAEVYVVGENGETLAPAGEHTLEDGTVIVVGDDGMIAEIKEVEMKKEEEELSQEDALEIIKSLNDRVTELETKLSAVESEKDSETQAHEATKEELSAKSKELAALKKKASADSVKDEKFSTKKKNETTTDEPKRGSRDWFKQYTEQ
jgi:hypothetical protein